MLCSALFEAGICSSVSLLTGQFAVEPCRPECQLSLSALRFINEGKDAAITHMLHGGNGFPEQLPADHLAEVQFSLGVQQERRDLRANNIWAADLTQALADRKRGRCNG